MKISEPRTTSAISTPGTTDLSTNRLNPTGGVMAAISIWSALAASREIWAIYNGFIAYLAMGTLLGGEWLLRRHLFPHAR